jgi:MFS family permease
LVPSSSSRPPFGIHGRFVSTSAFVLSYPAMPWTDGLARALLGLGGTFTKIGAPALLHEIAHPRLRPIVGTMYYGFYYTGSLTSACLCSEPSPFTSLSHFRLTLPSVAGLHISGSWSWRLPVIFQMLGPVIVLAISIRVPESPRVRAAHACLSGTDAEPCHSGLSRRDATMRLLLSWRNFTPMVRKMTLWFSGSTLRSSLHCTRRP